MIINKEEVIVRNMKKVWALVLTTAMALSVLSGCSLRFPEAGGYSCIRVAGTEDRRRENGGCGKQRERDSHSENVGWSSCRGRSSGGL